MRRVVGVHGSACSISGMRYTHIEDAVKKERERKRRERERGGRERMGFKTRWGSGPGRLRRRPFCSFSTAKWAANERNPEIDHRHGTRCGNRTRESPPFANVRAWNRYAHLRFRSQHIFRARRCGINKKPSSLNLAIRNDLFGNARIFCWESINAWAAILYKFRGFIYNCYIIAVFKINY